jgi:hypothetical protein
MHYYIDLYGYTAFNAPPAPHLRRTQCLALLRTNKLKEWVCTEWKQQKRDSWSINILHTILYTFPVSDTCVCVCVRARLCSYFL